METLDGSDLGMSESPRSLFDEFLIAHCPRLSRDTDRLMYHSTQCTPIIVATLELAVSPMHRKH